MGPQAVLLERLKFTVPPTDSLGGWDRNYLALSPFNALYVVSLQMANGHSADDAQSVGQPPSTLFKGCYLVQRGAIIFFNFLILLTLELGNTSIVRAFPTLAETRRQPLSF